MYLDVVTTTQLYFRGFTNLTPIITLNSVSTFLRMNLSITNIVGSQTFTENTQHPFIYSVEEESSGAVSMSFTDSIDSGRFTRFTNPMVEYEYRKGTYFTVWSDRFPNLTLSMIELGRNEYFTKWFKSKPYENLFKEDLIYYTRNFSKTALDMSLILSDG